MDPYQIKKWAKQTARVPRGYLRYQVLMILKDTPQSGSELADTLEHITSGEYRPGPGSIYPVLKKLHTMNFLEKLPFTEGVQRYTITKQGLRFMQDHHPLLEEVRDRLTAFNNPSTKPQPEQTQIQIYLSQISTIFIQLNRLSSELWSPQQSHDVEQLLASLATELENTLKTITQ